MANSALTCAVDFDEDYFDRGIHAFFANSSSPMLFVQALFRSRRFKDRVHDIWIEKKEGSCAQSTKSAYDYIKLKNDTINSAQCPINDKAFNLMIDLNAYKQAMDANRANIIIANLRDLGANIEFVDESEAQQNQKQLTEELMAELPPMKLTAKAVPKITISDTAMKYFLSHPQEKQKMVETGEFKGNAESQIQAISMTVIVRHLASQIEIKNDIAKKEPQKTKDLQLR